MTIKRNYGIDLLRIVFMFMVCMLHVLGQGGVLKACQEGTLKYNVFWFLEIFSYCAVDGFAMISGYIATDKPQKYEKIIQMWFQVFFYSCIFTLLLTVAGVNEGLSRLDIVKCAFPVTNQKYWYFTAYFGLFFLIPFCNKFIFSVDEISARKLLVILMVIFSFIGVHTDPFKTQNGYSMIWLLILYCIGGLAKRSKLFETKKTSILIILWVLCIGFTWTEKCFRGNSKFVSYISPTILCSALIMIVIFSRLDLKGTIIKKLSPLAFGIYLFQLNQVIWNNVLKAVFSYIPYLNVAMGVLYAFGSALAIFAAGLLVEYIRSILDKKLKISLISNKIVILIDRCLDKLLGLLK